MNAWRFGLVALCFAGVVGAQVNWTQQNPAVSPRAGQQPMAFDEARGVVVMFTASATGIAETWEWNGSAWMLRSPSLSPAVRGGHGLVYHRQRQRVILFGGLGFTDTWEWDGNNWNLLAISGAPTVFLDLSTAYDERRNRIVAEETLLRQTWEWDEVSWKQIPGPQPSEGVLSVMAFDNLRNTAIRFGGSPVVGGQSNNETWEWNGLIWTKLCPQQSPPPRSFAAMAEDRGRQRLVLFGGDSSNGDTWEWNGVTWLERFPPLAPIPRYGHGMAYDARRRNVVLFGGNRISGHTPLNDTWTYTTSQLAQYATFGAGCAGTAGVASVSPVSLPGPWLGSVFAVLVRPLPLSGVAAMYLGGSNVQSGPYSLPLPLAQVGMGSCALRISPDQLSPLSVSGGSATFRLAVPNVASLAGARFYNQALIADPGVNPVGLVLSDATEGIIGAR